MSEYDNFAPVYDRLMSDVDYDAWAEYIYAMLECERAKRVVECACGTGEIGLRLAKKGLDMTCTDISREMLERASEKARRMGVKPVFACMDMRKLCVHRPADAVISACDGVNYLASPSDMSMFFDAAYAALKKDGLLLFDISSRHKLRDIIGGNTFASDEEDAAYIWSNTYDDVSKLCEMRLTVFERRGELYEKYEETHIQRAHSVAETENRLKKAGFELIGAYEAFTLRACDDSSERIQFAARRV